MNTERDDSVSSQLLLKNHILDLDINSMYWQGIDLHTLFETPMDNSFAAKVVSENVTTGPALKSLGAKALAEIAALDIAGMYPNTGVDNWMHYDSRLKFPVFYLGRPSIYIKLRKMRVNNRRCLLARDKPSRMALKSTQLPRVSYWMRDPIDYSDRLKFRLDGRYPVGKQQVVRGRWINEYISELM